MLFTTEFIVTVSYVKIDDPENTRSVTESSIFVESNGKRIHRRVYGDKSILLSARILHVTVQRLEKPSRLPANVFLNFLC